MCNPYDIIDNEGNEEFLNKKQLSYIILQEIPDLFSYHKYSICKCILCGGLLYACAIFQSKILSLKTF